MSDLSPDAQQKILQLKKAYIDSLSEKLEYLHTNWQAIIKEPSDTSHLESLRVFSHKLAGSAGSYGLKEVSISASALDELIIELIKSTEHPKDVISQLKPIYKKLVGLLQDIVTS